MQSWERYIIYPLCAIAIIITLCAVSWNISADKSGFVVGVLAVLVTALVGWQIWQAVNTRQELRDTRDDIRHEYEREIEAIRRNVEEDRRLNQSLRDDLERRIDERVNMRINDYDHAVAAVAQLSLARAPLAAHQVLEFVNERLGTNQATNLLHSGLIIITRALQNINDCSIKDNVEELYNGLGEILDMVDNDVKQFAIIQSRTIEDLIDEIKREQRISGISRTAILSRLDRLKTIIASINNSEISEIVSRNHNGTN